MVTTATATPTTTYEKGQLYQLPLTDLQADPKQPRKYLDPQALQDLSDSIAQHGVLTPILFRVEISEETGGHDAASRPPVSSPPPASLFIVAGERRCEAAKTAGLTTIPASGNKQVRPAKLLKPGISLNSTNVTKITAAAAKAGPHQPRKVSHAL